MQATQRGIVLHSVSLLSSIARFAQSLGFRSIVDHAVVKGVRDYQKYVSPHKGFCCAHRKLHGTESCSEFFRQAVQAQGLVAAIPLFQARLAACKQAHLTLKAQAQTTEEESKDNQKKKQSSTSEPSTSSNNPCENLAFCDCGASNIDFGACAGSEQGFCDCGSFDVGGTAAGCGDCGVGACDSCFGCGDCSVGF